VRRDVEEEYIVPGLHTCILETLIPIGPCIGKFRKNSVEEEHFTTCLLM
jgi:hypothetical protein